MFAKGRALVRIPLIAVLMTALSSTPAHAAASCAAVRVPAGDHTISGTLCAPASYPGGVKRVDVLVHGATYDSAYWDWPVNPRVHSYVRRTTAEGRATLAYDRPGAGKSTKPPSTALTVPADADVLHQVVRWLRGRGFDEVTLIGHSLGSVIAIKETADHGDADRLVVTGLVHPPALGLTAPIAFASVYPAPLDPQFAGQSSDLGYLTTRPGTRGASFYHAPAADPEVIAYDEAHKDVVSSVELADALSRLALPPLVNDARGVRRPVLVVLGERDAVFCGPVVDCSDSAAVRVNERRYFASAPSLAAVVLPETGHDLPQHESAGLSFARIDQWIRTH
ncbi:alpha/beta fold hydrolase [Nonomuraea monospora]|uniref:Alpha/beta fold hydrolase n=1 Tax=Nonomuraea monospora TaxID=568818 RepID=A0ABN3CZU8_9ACTN